SCLPFPPLEASSFGLIQEKLAADPFILLVAVVFLNKTKGTAAIPKFWQLIERYPTPEALAEADSCELTDIIQQLGLQNERAKTLINLANVWVADPPSKGRRHRKLNYPEPREGCNILPREILKDDDERFGAWEIAHLPGCGAYALDSWRIFCRDKLRGLALDWNGTGAGSPFQPEWMRVVPKDKELRAFLRWMWLKHGWTWDPKTGRKERTTFELQQQAKAG
ncbi:DNA glycosylase, partial [Patellaria atrata CBS 101060]